MAYGKQVQEYQKSAVNGASPLHLIVMLYDGCLRFMEAGRYGMEHKDLEMQNQNLQRAQRIVMELMSCLDMDKGGEIAANLLALYTYVLDQLVEANVEDRMECVDHAMRVIGDLRGSWAELEMRLRAQPPAAEVQLAA